MSSRALVAAAVAAATALAAFAGAHRAPATPPPPDRALRAAALADAPDLSAAGQRLPAATARVQAALRGVAIPLPAGGTFNGVRWEQGGPITSAQLDGVLEYNAMCQWLRAWRDGRERALAARILQIVPSWPALRGTEAGRPADGAGRRGVRGGPDVVAGGVLRGCDASHAREVIYARRLGLAPGS